jgi:hypothetical protein
MIILKIETVCCFLTKNVNFATSPFMIMALLYKCGDGAGCICVQMAQTGIKWSPVFGEHLMVRQVQMNTDTPSFISIHKSSLLF